MLLCTLQAQDDQTLNTSIMSSLIVPNSDAVDPPIFRRLGGELDGFTVVQRSRSFLTERAPFNRSAGSSGDPGYYNGLFRLWRRPFRGQSRLQNLEFRSAGPPVENVGLRGPAL